MLELGALFEMQGQFFLLVLLGVFFRRKVVGAEFQKGFTRVLMDLILPCNILLSFQVELTEELIRRCLGVFGISMGWQILAAVLAAVMFRRSDPGRRSVKQFTLLCSNAGFLGVAVAEGIWSAEGVLLTSVYLIPQRLFMWSLGVSYFTSDKSQPFWKRMLSNTCILAMLIGVVLMALQWRLPPLLMRTVDSLSRCLTGMAMLMVGMMISGVKRKDFLDREVLTISALRLVVLPAVMLALCRLLRLDALAASVSVILAAMPAGTVVAILSARYDKAPRFGADVVTVSTLLSLITIPAWGLLVA